MKRMMVAIALVGLVACGNEQQPDAPMATHPKLAMDNPATETSANTARRPLYGELACT